MSGHQNPKELLKMTRKKKSKRKGKKLTARDLRREVFKTLKRQPKKRLNAKQIARKLKIVNSKDAIQHALDVLEKEGKITALGHSKYRYSKTISLRGDGELYEGKVDLTRSGAAYILIDELADDVYVPAKLLKGAINGDIVQVAVFTPRGRRRPEGQVMKVVKRATESFLGTLNIHKRYGIVQPDNPSVIFDIFVDLDNLNNAEDGDKVVVKVTKWPARSNNSPTGVITAVLGEAGSNDLEMQAILINNGFDIGFPEEVLQEAKSLPTEISAAEITKRRDFRGILTFTIDPDTAKDFDDALSLQYLEDGSCEVGVHIADVTHYVKPKTPLDKEAYNRSTSVYLVDRVCPMLPERLSNELCSLRPDEDKYTFSAVFVFDKDSKITSRWFGKTLIHSNRRFAYEEAQEILESGEGEFADELKKLNQLAKRLRKKKFKNGAIAFESDEVKFKLDEAGTPIDIFVKERKDAHMLIEDFMLLANKEVATFIQKKSKSKEVPFVYRVHDLPNPEKVTDFAAFAAELGFKMEVQTPRQIADSYNRLAKEARTNEPLKMLESIAIRTMAKAIYTTENIGHYGLAFDNYTHFTSPIRRYSDVLVHRLLEKNLEEIYRTNKEDLEAQCKHISSQERKAMDAERESIKYKQVEFVKQFVGQVMDGRISGMIDRGIFVELVESKAEGMVGFDRFDEVFEIADDRLKAIGQRSGRVLKMGDLVKVKILDTDLSKRQIDMALELVPVTGV